MSKVMNVKITGIIAEYNPLHPGHRYQLSEARRRTGCDYLVVVLSGCFTQRGEMALFDKYARVRMALAAGADAVFELSAVYAARCAQLFARGGTGVLAALGLDAISFGCETEDTEKLYAAQALLDRINEDNSELIQYLSEGISYPKALARATAGENAEILGFLHEPNFILALEYVNELRRRGATMEICPVRRTAPYRSEEASLFSASGVRKMLADGQTEAVLGALPLKIARIYLGEMPDGLSSAGRLDEMMLHALRNIDPGSVHSPDEAEGLFNRIQTCARRSASLEETVANVKCRRYTYPRIRRLITDAVLRLPDAPDEPPYLRLLGVRGDADALLKELKKRTSQPIITRAALLKDNAVFQAECRATDLWGLSTARRAYRTAGREFQTGFLRGETRE